MTGTTVPPDLILHGGRITTLDSSNPTASAVAIANGVFTAVGKDNDVLFGDGQNDTSAVSPTRWRC